MRTLVNYLWWTGRFRVLRVWSYLTSWTVPFLRYLHFLLKYRYCYMAIARTMNQPWRVALFTGMSMFNLDEFLPQTIVHSLLRHGGGGRYLAEKSGFEANPFHWFCNSSHARRNPYAQDYTSRPMPVALRKQLTIAVLSAAMVYGYGDREHFYYWWKAQMKHIPVSAFVRTGMGYDLTTYFGTYFDF